MGLFKKKLSDEELIKQNIAAQQAELEEKDTKKEDNSLGDSKLAIEVTKMSAQLEGLNEQRKATGERFSKISEDIGELRGMVMETNKSVSKIEAAATKAIDLVESVKPEELMVEVRKQDIKIESLKASIETNESMMHDLMKELKEMRRRMDFYKGVEQVAKMNEEIKQELIDIKKTEAIIDRHSSKIESIFLDVEKKFTEFDKFNDVTKDLKRNFDKLQSDVDKLRVRIEEKSDKKEVLTLINKFNEFEKHTTNIINLLDEKAKGGADELKALFTKFESESNTKLNSALAKFGVDATQLQTTQQEKSAVPTASSSTSGNSEKSAEQKQTASLLSNILSKIKGTSGTEGEKKEETKQ